MVGNLYGEISNPIDDDAVLGSIVSAYSNSNSLYKGITNINSKNRVNEYYSYDDNNKLYVMIFNEWKNTIIRTAMGDMSNRDETSKKMILALARYLSDKNPTTFIEVKRIIDPKNTRYAVLREALYCFSCADITEDHKHWNYVDSMRILHNGVNKNDIEHRLYVNCDSTYIHKIIYEFCRRCNARGIPYYLKYHKEGGRDDCVVFYCPTEQLGDYLDVLRSIKYISGINQHVHRPPILTGVVDGWIGYGSEPDEHSRESFNSKRADHLSSCIFGVTHNMMLDKLNMTVRDRHKIILSYEDYLIRKIINSKKDWYKRMIRDGNMDYGFSLEDLESFEFAYSIRNALKSNFRNNLGTFENFNIPFKNGIINISHTDYMGLIKDQAIFLYNNIPEYRDILRTEIKNTSDRINIDYDNYAFDVNQARTLGKNRVMFDRNFGDYNSDNLGLLNSQDVRVRRVTM